MTGDLRELCQKNINKAVSELDRGQYDNALKSLGEAGKLAQKAEAPDLLSVVFGTTGSVFQSAGRYDKALENLTIALNIQEELAKIEPFFNTWVATTLNNLGNLLSNMGKLEDAKEKYEGALEKYEALL